MERRGGDEEKKEEEYEGELREEAAEGSGDKRLERGREEDERGREGGRECLRGKLKRTRGRRP